MFIATHDGSLIDLADVHTIGRVPGTNVILAARRNSDQWTEEERRIVITNDADRDYAYIRKYLELCGQLVNWVDPVDGEDLEKSEGSQFKFTPASA